MMLTHYAFGYAPFLEKGPCFCTPLFVAGSGNEPCMQYIGENETIRSFIPISEDREGLIRNLRKRRERVVGQGAIYAFRGKDGRVVLGERDEIASELKGVFSACLERPYLARSVARFVNDENLVAIAEDAIASLERELGLQLQDDLKLIRGIGVLIEQKLTRLGIKSYAQIAAWSQSDIDRVSQILDFRGRIERENWVEQARILNSGGETEFSREIRRDQR